MQTRPSPVSLLVMMAIGMVPAVTTAQSGEDSDEFDSDDPSTRFSVCRDLDKRDKWRRAAECYQSYVEDFPDADYADDALWNAAQVYEANRRSAKGIQLRLLLLKRYTDSELAPKNLFRIATNYHSMASYARAATFYEKFAETYPQRRERALRAIRNAAAFRDGLGERRKAIENYTRALELMPDDESASEKRAELRFQIGELYRKLEAYDEAVEAYRRVQETGDEEIESAVELEALAKIGGVARRRGDTERERDVFRKVRDRFQSLPSEVRETGRARGAVARASFHLARARVDRFGPDDLPDAAELKSEGLKALRDIRTELEEVIKYRRVKWAVAALFEIGRLQEKAIDRLEAIEIPPDVEERETYLDFIEGRVGELESRAVQAYERVVVVARREHWHGDHLKRAVERLRALRPDEYRPDSEIRARGTATRDGYARAGLMTRLEER